MTDPLPELARPNYVGQPPQAAPYSAAANHEVIHEPSL